jgi:hypothetical protein
MKRSSPPHSPDAKLLPDPVSGQAADQGRPTDRRRARRRHERQLVALAVGVLVIVGGALIALVYGPPALLTALPCLLAGAGAILILYLLLLLVERWINR